MRDLESEVERRKASAKKSGLGDVWVRTVEKAIKLALVAAVSDDCGEISRVHAEWAGRRALASDQALERAASGNISETDHGKLQNAIWRYVAAHTPKGGITKGVLHRECWGYRDAKPREREDALGA